MTSVSNELDAMRALLDAITGDLDAQLARGGVAPAETPVVEEPEEVEEERWHSC